MCKILPRYIYFFVELFKLFLVCSVFSEISLFAFYEFSTTYQVCCLKIIFSPLFLGSHFISEHLKNCILLTSEIAEKISVAITSKKFQLSISIFLILIRVETYKVFPHKANFLFHQKQIYFFIPYHKTCPKSSACGCCYE